MSDEPTTNTPEEKLIARGIILPLRAPTPVGAFCNVRRTGRLLYVSGQGPVRADRKILRGKIPSEVSAEDARAHAELVAVNILAALKGYGGSLNKVKGVVKLLGLVNADPDFEHHPFVIDGASELLNDIFGEAGVHARSALGMGSLPNRISVEIEAIFELADTVE